MTCFYLLEFPRLTTGANVSQVTELTLEGGNIISISNNSLPPGLISLDLFRHPFTNISDDAFDSSLATLRSLSIVGAKFTSLPAALKKLTSLTRLVIDDTRIQFWDTVLLNHLADTVEHLQLSNMGLSKWPSWISDFRLLHTLDLSSNPLKSIPKDALNFIKDLLTFLSLKGTGLTYIPQALMVLSNLTTLDLSSNNITDVSEVENLVKSAFSQTLSVLHLDSTGLTRMPNLSNLTRLHSLTFTHNKISDVPAGSLPLSLTSLYLSFNGIKSVPKDISSMTGLSYLDLSGNLLTYIEPNSFPSSLTDLHLSFTNLTTITNTTFSNLNLLRILDLSYNYFSTFPHAAFTDLVSLIYLYLSDCNLTEFPLAFTALNPQTDIFWTMVHDPACPCPAAQELIQWSASLKHPSYMEGRCSNGQSIASYLSGQCGQQPVAP
ncbi:unnamed protein product [Candidula unifasciata]|uniref:L domain-like protein n=1 Tax=Candidula unifasciata TaxID=100452 RepID=A0A8S3YRL3_9EUPU|nr:unnamed protein product [Candidula unifasciata]